MAKLVKRLTLAQIMISQFMSSSLTLGSVLTSQSLEPALKFSLSCPNPAHTLSPKINIKKNNKIEIAHLHSIKQ